MKATLWNRIMIFFRFQSHELKVYAAKEGNKVVATLSVLHDSESLSVVELFPEICHYRKIGQISEIGYLATDSSYKGKKALELVLEPLMTVAIVHAITDGIRHIAITVNPRHRLHYEKKAGFQILANGDVRKHPKVKKAPAVGLVLDLDESNCPDYVRHHVCQHTAEAHG